MRNLKRALSMALASIMLMGTMAMSASAINFTDADSITNTDAVTVVAALEVMIGRDTGDFDPAAVVTRAEMATILCRVVYGLDYQANGYEGITTFTDVAGHWAEAEIGMAYANGWINGKSAESFDPNATVQAYEAYVMMQRALGYYDSADTTSYNLGTYAMTLASRLGMSADISTGAYAGLTRENVATAVYNTLFDCAKVAYSSWTGLYYAIDIDGDVSITNPNVSVEFGATGTFAADVHEVTIVDSTDLMGRPVKNVEVDGETLATTAVDYTAIFTSDDEFSDVVKNMETTADSTNLLWNGETATLDKVFSSDEIIAGTVVEVYDDYNTSGEKTGSDTTYIAYTYSYGEITKIEYDEDKDTTEIRVSSKTYSIDGEIDFVKGDEVMFTAAGSELDTLTDVITVEGEITGIATSFLKLDGTTYTYAKAGSGVLTSSALGDTYTLYVTPYGFVLDTELVEDSGTTANYLYITDAQVTLGTVKAKAVFADGSTAIIEVAEVGGKDSSSVNDSADGAVKFDASNPYQSVYSYSKNSDGTYDLTVKAAEKLSVSAYISNGYTYPVTASNGKVSGFTAFDDDTVFVDVENGAVYVGYESVPDYTEFTTGNLFQVDNVVFMIGGDADDSEVGIYVYIDGDDAYSTKIDSTTYTVYTEAYLNGELVSGGLYSKVSLTAGNLYEVEMDADGYVTKIENIESLTVTADDEVLTVGSYTIHLVGAERYTFDSDSVFVLIDNIDDAVSVGSVSDLMAYDADNDDMTQLVVISDDDGYIELAYIILSEKAVIG